ncbi:MAG: twin-arginine translocation signal domain-containing protein [Actinomycetota bacterium]
MDRREFLKRAGIGSIGLSTLAVTSPALAGYRKGNGHQHFSLVALSSTSASEATNHVMILEGAGSFKAKTGQVDPKGGGNFIHVEDFPSPGSGPFASGKWNVKRFVSYDAGPPFGDYGRIRASILVVTVVLRPDAGGSLEGTLEIACNVGFAGIQTGEPEGFKLSVPGFDFDTPFLGLTHLSIPEGASSA